MKRIDLYTIDIGGGHIAPAQALKEQFTRAGYDDVDVRVVNLGIELGMKFLRYVYKFYWNLALRYPPLINAFYRGADNPFIMKVVDRLMGITALPKFVAYLEREKPDLVLSTYFTFTHFLELLKHVGQLDAVSVVLNPEPFDSHQIWFSPAFDWSLVFSEKSAREIVEKGLPAARVKTFGFPIKPSAAPRKELKAVLRRRLGLRAQPFTVLLFFGAEGIGPVRRYVATMIDRGLPLQLVVVCGRNERLRAGLEAVARGPTGALSLVVKGFVTNLPEHIAAADVVVGKSGPNQVFETLLQRRPLVISSFLANEKETTRWVVENKVGWLSRSPEHLVALLGRLQRHPEVLDEYQRNVARLSLRSGAPEICAFLRDLVSTARPPRKRRLSDALRELREKMAADGEAAAERRRAAAERRKAAAARRRREAARRRKQFREAAEALLERAAAPRTRAKKAPAARGKRAAAPKAGGRGRRAGTGRPRR